MAISMATPLWAETGAPPKSFSELYPPLPGVEYFCTDASGDRADLGAVICVTASCQTWMARCEMAASNRMAMWRKVQDGCPAVGLDTDLTSGQGPLARLHALKQAL